MKPVIGLVKLWSDYWLSIDFPDLRIQVVQRSDQNNHCSMNNKERKAKHY